MQMIDCARRSRRAFTLTDFCAVFAAVMILLAALPAVLRTADDADKITQCRKNLQQIGDAMHQYSIQNNGRFPRTYFQLKPNSIIPDGPIHEYTGANAAKSFGAPDSPSGNDVSASIYLLMKATGFSPKLFVCPAGDAIPFPDPVAAHSNFPSGKYLSYSMACPFPTDNALKENYGWDVATLSFDDPLFSDMNPGGPDLITLTPTSDPTKGNSRNQGRSGQNVLYADSSVRWQKTPFCGAEREGPPKYHDNIFTAQTTPPTIVGYVQDHADTVMLPVADASAPEASGTGGGSASPNPPAVAVAKATESTFPWMMVTLIGAAVVAAIALILISRSRRRA